MITDLFIAVCDVCDGTYYIFSGDKVAEIKKCNCVDGGEFDWVNMHQLAYLLKKCRPVCGVNHIYVTACRLDFLRFLWYSRGVKLNKWQKRCDQPHIQNVPNVRIWICICRPNSVKLYI